LASETRSSANRGERDICSKREDLP
jgi:hypothetical protein